MPDDAPVTSAAAPSLREARPRAENYRIQVDNKPLRYLHCASGSFHVYQEVRTMALLMKPEPFATEFDRLFNQLFDRNEAARRWVPAMDLVEGEDHFVLRADLPGMGEADVNIRSEERRVGKECRSRWSPYH